MSDVEILRLKRQANEFSLQIAERTNRFRSDANSELNRLESELAQAEEILRGRQDVMNRTTVVAPVRGTVNNIRVTTRGGVIQQGAEIMTIIPLEDNLLVEAKIKPSDVAFIHPGLPATVKITAYDYAIYGGLTGVVEHLSSDTLIDEEKRVRDVAIRPITGSSSAPIERHCRLKTRSSQSYQAWWRTLKSEPGRRPFCLTSSNRY